MRHVSDANLRRLVDEPFAVSDSARRHRDGCDRCRARGAEIGGNAAFAFRLLSAPPVACDGSPAWAQLQHRLASPAQVHRPAVRMPRRPARRLARASVSTGAAVTIGLVAAGVATAATLTTVFAPTTVAPVYVSQGEVRAIMSMMGVGTLQSNGRLPSTGS